PAAARKAAGGLPPAAFRAAAGGWLAPALGGVWDAVSFSAGEAAP
ncbi:dethiobiotin synthase, partial [Streptomyces scabiei]|nr:dethiobiotin synthase [Streptomyces scabiei]